MTFIKINKDVYIELVEIPCGAFLMDNSLNESEFRENETPQNQVKALKFFINAD